MQLSPEVYRQLFVRPPKGPCISLYMPTFRANPDKEQNIILYKNLTKKIEQSLAKQYSAHEIARLLSPLYKFMNHRLFWQYANDGLVFFVSPESFSLHRLQKKVPALAMVGEHFHIKPLLRLFQSADRYQVLGVDRQKMCLYQGTRYRLDEVELIKEIPQTIDAVLNDRVAESRLTVASYGGSNGGNAMYHGHGGKKDHIDMDTKRFFAQVDMAINRYYSKPSNLPLLLGALPENQGLFREVSRNPMLMDVRLDRYPTSLPNGELKDVCWSLIHPYYQERIDYLVESFYAEQAQNKASDDLDYIAEMIHFGRVKTLLIDEQRQIGGIYRNGKIKLGNINSPDIGDLLEDLAESVLLKSGDVMIIPTEYMPTNTGIAAIMRY